jgi:hypothetical protein
MTSTLMAKPRHASGSSRTKFAALIAAVASIFVLAACHFVGSGTVTSAYGWGKATFTFDLNCPPQGGASGVLTYVDSPARVMFHAFVPGSALQTSCVAQTVTPTRSSTAPLAVKAQLFSAAQSFQGSYTPLKGGTGGTFSVTVASGGTAQSFPGWFCITLTGGVYDGYTNSGPIQWGNIVAVP